MLAFDAMCQKDKTAALEQIKQMEAEQAPHYQLAIVYALLHDTDDAIAGVEQVPPMRMRDRFSTLSTILSSTKSATIPGMWRWRSAWG